MNSPARRWHLNVRGLIGLIAVVAVVAVILTGWAFWRGRNATTALRDQAEIQLNANPPHYDLALSYLDAYLKHHPDDPQALDRKSDVLAKLAQTPDNIQAAITVGEHALRLQPDGPEADATRRRVVGLYLDLARFLPPERQALGTAEQIALRLTRDGTAQDAPSLRLLARVLRLRAAQGDPQALEGDPTANPPRPGAIPVLEQARALDPTDVASALELAQLYRFQRTPPDPDRAVAVLDDLLAAHAQPTTPRDAPRPALAQARLARYRYFTQAATDERDSTTRAALRKQAATELEAALVAAPDDLVTRLTAAEFAAVAGDLTTAREHLDHIPVSARGDLSVRLVQGLVERAANQPEAAIAAWRQGLQDTGGTNAELTWRLAEVLLQLGRLAEAEPLIRQHRRLTGGAQPAPSHRYLLGLELLRMNRPREALDELAKAQFAAGDDAFQAQVLVTIGQAHEALRNTDEALNQYDKAIQLAPRWPTPRLARARVIQVARPDEAVLELRAALDDQPDDPSMLVALARAQLSAELRRPVPQRRWDDLRQTLDQARRVASHVPGLALVEADFQALMGQLDSAADQLREAIRHDPRNVELWTAWAGALLRQDKPEDALAALERAAGPNAAGDQVALRIARARLLTALNRGRQARDALTTNADRLPPDQQALLWAELTAVLRQRREFDDARAAGEHWAALAPGDPQPLLALLELDDLLGDRASGQQRIQALERLGPAGRLYGQVARAQQLLQAPPHGQALSDEDRDARFRQAEALIATIDTDAPQQSFAPMLQGLLAERRGLFDDAAAAYEKALDRGATAEAANRLAVLYGRLGWLDRLDDLRRRLPNAGAALDRIATTELLARGQGEEAERLAQRLAAGDPDSLDARLWKARVLNTVGKPDEAETALRDLAEKSDEPAPWLTLLFFQIGQKRPTEALTATIDLIKQRVTKIEGVPELLWAQCHRAAGNNAAAQADYEAALAKAPEDPRVARGAAEFFQAIGRVDRAEALLRGVLQRDPAQRWAARGLALVLSNRADDWAEAWSLAQVPTETTEAPEDRFTRAMVLARGPDPKRHEEAEAILERLVADLPPSLPIAVSARDILINEALRRGQPDRARRFAAVAAADGANPTAIAVLAETSIQSGRLDEAERQIERLAAVAPGDLNVIKLRALLLVTRGQAEDAAKAVEAACAEREAGPDGELATRELLSLFVPMIDGPAAPPTPLADQAETAERIARRLATRWPRSSWALARVLARAQQPEAALGACRAAVEAPDVGREDLLQAVRLAAALGAIPSASAMLQDAAGAVFEAALKWREPNVPEVLLMTAYLRHVQGRYDEELELYRRLDALQPADPAYLNNMAWVLSENFDRPTEALPLIDRLLARVGDNHQCLDTKGMVLVRSGRAKEAVAVFQRVVQARPDNPLYLYHLARACLKNGDETGFRAYLDQALKLGLTVDRLEASERAEFEQLARRP